MEMKITVYGAEVQCASCVGAPSSTETYEWLQSALGRKYPEHRFEFEYIDFETVDDEIAEAIRQDEWFYPLVLLDGEVVDEGVVQLRKVYAAIEQK
ncbi:YuzD family protein [Exiguobacterium sp. ZOR0005]|uniref:YuzD family protein n=1 Tax=Exiguobacterium sp. ZOR0005 TaxID=1339226 RepID=UPI000462B5B0|nr:YuzD family protein [Exiguobacterium sp. ZOR0005]